MKKKKIFSIILVGLVVTGCASKRNAQSIDQYAFNGVSISDSLFCDQTEVTNFSWLEYMHWNKRVFGENSEKYKSTIPDTNVWNTVACEVSYGKELFRNTAYRSFPVIGVSQDQAREYSQWRSDRVFEVYLIDKGKIKSNPNQNGENFFSVSNYYRGNYFDNQEKNGKTTGAPVEPDLNLAYPSYRLPNSNDRTLILDYVDSTDFRFHKQRKSEYEKWRETYLPFRLARSICSKTLGGVTFPYRTTQTGLDTKNRFKLIHDSRGNVAEWGDEFNTTYGGGWPHNVEYVLENDSIQSKGTNAWTGFRNVWEWKKWNPSDVNPK